jgi:hypothetical protein
MKILRDKFVYGLVWGTTLPALGFGAFYGLNEMLVNNSAVSSGWIGFKLSSIALFAICLNLVPTFFANRRMMDNYIRGIMMPTILYAFTWFFYFGKAYLG